MHEGSPRMNGGIGFAIEGPTANIVVCEADEIVISDERSCPMALSELDQLRRQLERFAQVYGIVRRAAIRIGGAMRTHWICDRHSSWCN